MRYSEKLKVYSNSEIFHDIKKRCEKIKMVLETVEGMERKAAYVEISKASYQRKMIKSALTELIVNRRVKVQLKVKHAIKDVGAWQIEGQRKRPTIIQDKPIVQEVSLIKPIESAIDISMIKPIDAIKRQTTNKVGYDMFKLPYEFVAFDLLGKPVRLFKPGQDTWTDVCRFAVGETIDLEGINKGVSARKGNILNVLEEKAVKNSKSDTKTVKKTAYGYQWKKLSAVQTK